MTSSIAWTTAKTRFLAQIEIKISFHKQSLLNLTLISDFSF